MCAPEQNAAANRDLRKGAEHLGRDTSLLRETEARAAGGNVVDNVLALEEDVAEDVEPDARVVLDTAEAGAGAGGDGGVVDVLARHGLSDTADGDGEGGQGSTAREDVATLGVVVLSAADLGVVSLDDGRVNVDQSCASVDDGVNLIADGGARADLVAGGSEAPETLAVVDGNVGDGTSVLGGVDEAEVIGTGGVVLEGDSEELLSKRALDSVEEGLLSGGGDSVDAAESKTEKTVGVLILLELCRDRGGSLDSLGGGSHTSNSDLISVDLARRAGTIAVADLPRVATLELGGISLVVVVTSKLGRGLEVGEDPAFCLSATSSRESIWTCLQISRSGVEVKVQVGGANGDWAEIGRVVLVAGVSGLRSTGGSSSVDRLSEIRSRSQNPRVPDGKHTLARASAAFWMCEGTT